MCYYKSVYQGVRKISAYEWKADTIFFPSFHLFTFQHTHAHMYTSIHTHMHKNMQVETGKNTIFFKKFNVTGSFQELRRTNTYVHIYTGTGLDFLFFFFLTHPLFKIPYSNNSDDWTRTTKCKYKWETIKSFQHFLWSLTQWEGRRLLGG